MRRTGLVLCVALVAVALPVTVRDANTSAASAAGALDCDDWRYGTADEPAPGTLPVEFDRNSYKRTSLRDARPELHESPHRLCGQKGPALDLAFGVSKGRNDVLIAVLDSGIRWRSPGAMGELANKAYINLREARPPCVVVNGDCNSDGVFDVRDFGPIPDLNSNGLADPEDLILDPAYNNDRDDDRNGHIDDISGWDFLYGDNNPLDSPSYGHGTGEAEDSTAAENGTGDVGSCPRCRFLPVRVSDSFIADGARFAAGVLFALDNGADVVQEALGALSNPRQAQQAIDAAYARGVVVVASMADEAAKHPNLPSSLEHTMAVNSVTEEENLLGGGVQGYLALNGCTNFGGRTFVGVPSGSCSSEATGISSGMVGLLESVARDAHLSPHPALAGMETGNLLSANEAMQVVRSTADDIDFSTPNAHDPANEFGTPTGGLLDTVRYPTTAGWDGTFGYGRINAYEIVRAARDGRIPPEAYIEDPQWFDVASTHGGMVVSGYVAAERADSYDYRLEWAVGMQAPPWPGRDTWHLVRRVRNLHNAHNGTLGVINLSAVAAELASGGSGAPVDAATGRPDEERFSVRIRVVVTAHGGAGDRLVGEHQKQVFVHDDPDLWHGFPRDVAGAATSSPVFADLDGHRGAELILATDDGEVHAFRHDGNEITGFPVSTGRAAWWPARSRTARADGILPPRGGVTVGAPVVADLDGDHDREIVVADLDGNVWAWEHTGERRRGFGPLLVDGRRVSQAHVNRAFAPDDPAVLDEHNRMKPGIGSSPAAGDLDGDGRLEVVVAALDRHVYAWHDDGTAVSGFPVLVVDPAKVGAVDPVTHRVTFAAGSNVREGGELIATPALADLTGDGRPEIVVGAQEEYEEPINIGSGADVIALIDAVGGIGNSRLYAISSRGTNANYADRSAAHPDDDAYLPGWPFALGMLQLESLPTIGDGVSAQAAIGDVHPSPGREIVAAAAVGPLYVLNAAGQSVFGTASGKALPLAWAGGVAGQNNSLFGASRNSNDIVASIVAFGGPSIGPLDGDARADVTAPTAGLTRLVDVLGPDMQLPNDDHLMAWRSDTGTALPGFPRATPDLAFFVQPVIADIDGDGANETIAGNGVYTLSAYDAGGSPPSGWPKLTGGWLVGSPGVGDWDGDGRAELAVVRRDGVLIVWRTRAPARGIPWARYGGGGRNAGVFSG